MTLFKAPLAFESKSMAFHGQGAFSMPQAGEDVGVEEGGTPHGRYSVGRNRRDELREPKCFLRPEESYPDLIPPVIFTWPSVIKFPSDLISKQNNDKVEVSIEKDLKAAQSVSKAKFLATVSATKSIKNDLSRYLFFQGIPLF